MAQKVKPVRGADADSVARTVHSPVNGDLNTRDEERISAKKDGELSSSLSLGADLSSLTRRRKKERRRTERSTAISVHRWSRTLTGGKQRRVLAQVKVRSRGSAEKARETRSEKRSSSESGIHRDSAPKRNPKCRGKSRTIRSKPPITIPSLKCCDLTLATSTSPPLQLLLFVHPTLARSRSHDKKERGRSAEGKQGGVDWKQRRVEESEEKV
ncbi:hypothetical protein ALC56_10435 [Trachymyrmex septentrionalis]|uniref:Uncharacterized protein n=1 Tax=Trachymyrmex septentrionalis TaxID=34720 RepID=A0A195F3V3_9HYME|nr:hypothetical protein ALC56_10435 [Trachymyrmex septentrionalis]